MSENDPRKSCLKGTDGTIRNCRGTGENALGENRPAEANRFRESPKVNFFDSTTASFVQSSTAVPTDEKSYGSVELDKILRDRRESLKRIRADLRRVEELQKELQQEQERQKAATQTGK